ncbi:aspartate/glutamate racemase family protein [Pseudomonas syringae]|uniref:aspartate/glutamate racemase family protein n=1 Tax=Pseudomonas syringae TaxID=317 RepID=UPI0018E63254|nr:aspartate/glutamate racemase family protein [Pseudomonas syringae]MBI6750929.1 aspartate/glutamate racemase family protein [Pseudomonas syringae]MBI6769254.1 aspartate/glutamate racemase family protein [Pseudomonas syringae]MBI6778573.1 aspartate/glutamate racemase family protein [Pseudomonas syringae]MBI6793746.1 aspartate/glutamate racemase family protein [Pseudomonas syringae]MBI6804477.1 aspartate/glutamate racemase family protein [Pseudomonas syringae]
MRTIGLIGGMSFEGSAVYYRQLNQTINRRLGGLHSAQVLLHSVDFQTIVDKQKTDRWNEAGEQLAAVAKSLEKAGADCVMICAVTMHLVADAVEAATTLPFIHIVDAVAERLKASGLKKPLLIATKYTMENGFYPARMKGHGIDVLVPEAGERGRIHDIIFEELSLGKVLDSSRDELVVLIEQAKANGADSVIFGCTEICMILETDKLPLPGFDSTAIHVEAAVEFALSDH